MSDPTPGKKIKLPEYTCKVCGATWRPRKPVVPLRCGHCKSPRWHLGPSERAPIADDRLDDLLAEL